MSLDCYSWADERLMSLMTKGLDHHCSSKRVMLPTVEWKASTVFLRSSWPVNSFRWQSHLRLNYCNISDEQNSWTENCVSCRALWTIVYSVKHLIDVKVNMKALKKELDDRFPFRFDRHSQNALCKIQIYWRLLYWKSFFVGTFFSKNRSSVSTHECCDTKLPFFVENE